MELIRVAAAMSVVVALVVPGGSWAGNCGMLSYSVEDAQSKLRRAANETNFEEAKDQARRARNALEDAAMAAQDCKCTAAYTEFEEAAIRARRARDADSAEELVDNLNRAIRSFNAAIDALRKCARTNR